MSKRTLTFRSALTVMLSVLLLSSAVLTGCSKPADPTTAPTTQPTQPSTTQPTETTTTPPGVADSIFDENTGETKATEPQPTTQPPETTVPVETTKPTESTPPATTQPPTTVSPATTLPPETTVPPTTVPPTTVPPETEAPTTEPPTTAPPATEPTQGTVSPDSMTYEAYNALSASEQKAFMNSFASIDKFFEWYNAAKKAYEEAHPPIDVGDGNIDIGDIIGGNG